MDITATKEAERALAASERRLRAIVEEGGDIIPVLDPLGNMTFIGNTALSIMGYKSEALLAKMPLTLFIRTTCPGSMKAFCN